MADMGNESDAAERAAREATAWFVRLNDPRVSDADRRAFRAWLQADPSNERAMAEARALWDDLREPAARLGQGGWYRERRRRRLGRAAAAFAAFAAVLCAVAVWRDPGLVDRALADHATRPGERRDVTLSDGTLLHLDGDTALRATTTVSSREVTLLRGRAWFDVARDERRPFVVHAGAVDARAVGTAFAVDRTDGSVTVDEGEVAVSAGGTSATLTADERTALAPDGRLEAAERVDPLVAGAWRRGLIVLDAAPLGAVAAELSRLEAGRVIIPADDVARLRLSGTFRAEDPAAIVEAMRAALGLKVARVAGFATIVYR